MHLPKHTVVAYATEPPTFVMTTSSALHPQPSVGTPKSLDSSALRDKYSAKCMRKQNNALSKALQAKYDYVYNLVGVIHYKPCTD